ncbi:UDP-N-acetylglucosamine--dolichyl-phosphate N-acetylglucosaminephosphotransferase [Acidianus sulfidivorans JP7]|uniref:UDP-N-acetylglucosamine--dolichyl-phosphate N-acetylglucosaminephosphotransferase n=1 Tax=Acidianus sulfidivorans JP7 TaxID=619593 RepID=A0A2U9IQI6_9CREN|nr:UDP-N-acetylglucosamine--dolichyl-phosphate N-acetylglucosaminephosphotransferase [Acidianus sulfidivorans JP7]
MYPLIISFFVTFLSTRWIIQVSKSRNIVGKDVNKKDKPEIPSLGGIGIITGFISGAFSLLVINPDHQRIISAILLSSLLIAFLGLLDDFLNLRQAIRAFTPIFAAVPLSLFSLGHSVISIPFIGQVNFGMYYYIFIIPIALTITSNAFNMLEGLNGLGAGLGLIMSSALAFIGITKGTGNIKIAGELALTLSFSLLAFLYYNKYPAKVFIGNVGTYFVGSVIGSIGISGFMYTALAVLYIPYVIEFILKARTRFKGVSFGKVNSDGTLYWDQKPNSLTHVVMKLGRFKEYQVVGALWIIEIIFAVLAVYLQTTVIVI